VKFGAHDKSGELLWPENVDEKKLAAEEASAVIANTLSEFYMERRSEIRLDKERDFQSKYFRYEAPPSDAKLFKSLYQDPAISEREKADRCTFTVVGMTEGGRLYVLEQHGERGMKPRTQIDMLFDLYKKWQPDVVGIESNSFQKALVHLTQEEMFRKRCYFEITPVTNAQAKHSRIKGILQPRFAAGYISFAGRFAELEKELLNFPLAAHDDHADGLAGAVSLLDPAAYLAGDEAGEPAKPLAHLRGKVAPTAKNARSVLTLRVAAGQGEGWICGRSLASKPSKNLKSQ
jgi:predicted phage terminase large subunit-like protein